MQSINLQGKNAAELAELKKAWILDQKSPSYARRVKNMVREKMMQILKSGPMTLLLRASA